MAKRILKVESAFRFPDFAAFVAAEPAAAEKAACALRRVVEGAEAVGNDRGCTRPLREGVSA